MNKCGSCGAELRALQMTCDCGWAKPIENKEQERRRHFQCEYRSGGERCPAPGTICAATVPQAERTWLCIHHWQTRFDPTGAQMALKDMQRNGVPPVKNWLDEEHRIRFTDHIDLVKAMKKVAEKHSGESR